MAKVAKIGTVYWLDSPRPEFRRSILKKVLLKVLMPALYVFRCMTLLRCKEDTLTGL